MRLNLIDCASEISPLTRRISFSSGTYGATGKAKQKELDESYKKNMSFNKEEEKIANEKTSNEMKYNKLILLESQNQERIDKRNKVIVETAKMAGKYFYYISFYEIRIIRKVNVRRPPKVPFWPKLAEAEASVVHNKPKAPCKYFLRCSN